MKKFLAVILALTMVFALVGCNSSLFSDDSVVKFEELYTHKDPDGLKYDERKVLINKDFAATIEEVVNAAAYPDTLKLDDSGNIIGMYDYDPETGKTTGWTNTTTGEFVAEVVDLGKPDESLMIHLAGTVTLGCVIYGNEGKAVSSYLYAFLSDAADKDIVKANMESSFAVTMEAESDTVLVLKQDEAAIDAKFQEWQELYGQVQSDRSATAYAENMKMELGLKTYGVNPYAPCSAIVDPEGLEFDEKIILTSSGGYSFADESLEKEMSVRTDVIYGYQGKAVAHYTYYEYNNKAAADKLMDAANGNFFGKAVRISDTVVQDQLEGQNLQDIIQTYIGYNVLKDDSLSAYAANVEESFFMMRYEG